MKEYRILPLDKLLEVTNELNKNLHKKVDEYSLIQKEVYELTEVEYMLWPEGAKASEIFDENGLPIMRGHKPKQVKGYFGKYSHWAKIRDGENGLKQIKTKRISFLIDQIKTQNNKLDERFLNKLVELTHYSHYEVRDKVSGFLKENYKDVLIERFCDKILEVEIDDESVNEQVENLGKLQLSPSDLTSISTALRDKLIATLKLHIGSDQSDEDNAFYLTILLGVMLNAFPKESAVLQNQILKSTSSISSYDDFELMCFTLRSNKGALTFWDQKNIITLGDQIANITRKEFTKGDEFGENNLKPTLEMISTFADVSKVTETLHWIQNM